MTEPPGYPPPYGPPGPYIPPPQPYSAQPYPYAPPSPATNWWAIVSLVFGILGGVLVSVICGIVALNKTKTGRYGRGRGMAIAGLDAVGALGAVLRRGGRLLLQHGRNSVDAADVKVGDCLADIPDGSRVSFIHVVPCEDPHEGEVFTVLTMPDGDFPGQAEIEEYQGRCEPELAAYSSAAATDPAVGLFVLYPTEESWGRTAIGL